MNKNSKLLRLLAALFAIALIAAACGDDGDVAEDEGGRLAAVIDRGSVNCGVNDTLPGFGNIDANGNNAGFDVDFCRVVAAAVLGDADAVNYTPLDAPQRFPTLQSGEIDLLVRNTTWTASRDGNEQANFMFTTFFDGQGLHGSRRQLDPVSGRHGQHRHLCASGHHDAVEPQLGARRQGSPLQLC